jgi:hypothetical protein
MPDKTKTWIEVWDLDYTILDTGQLFDPIIGFVVSNIRRDPSVVRAAFKQACDEGFTIANWLDRLNIPGTTRERLEQQIGDMVEYATPRCLYPGMLELLRERAALGARLVLLTAGNDGFQRWKFGLLTELHGLFSETDRYFVGPADSKADTVRIFAISGGRVAFVDDSRRQQYLVSCLGYGNIHQIRPQWPESPVAGAGYNDGQLWQVVTTMAELNTALGGA